MADNPFQTYAAPVATAPDGNPFERYANPFVDKQRSATALERVLDAISSDTYAVAGGLRGAIRGENPVEAAGRSVTQDHVTFGDILRDDLNVSPLGAGLLGFGLDVALSPSTYLGVGGLTKAGKASRAASLGLKFAEHAGDAERMLEAGERVTKLGAFGENIAEQAQRGQRALLTFGGRKLIGGAPVLEAAAKAGNRLREIGPVGRTVDALGDKLVTGYRFKGLERDVYRQLRSEIEAASREGVTAFEKETRPARAALAETAGRLGIKTDDLSRIMSDVVETSAPSTRGPKTSLPVAVEETLRRHANAFGHIEDDVARRKAMDDLTPHLRDMASMINAKNAAILERVQAAGIPATGLDDIIGYLRRQLRPEARELMEKSGVEGFAGRRGEDISDAASELLQREFRGKTLSEINELAEKGKLRILGFKPLKGGLFYADPFVATGFRVQHGIRQAEAARVIEGYAARFGRTLSHIDELGLEGKPKGFREQLKQRLRDEWLAEGYAPFSSRQRGLGEVWLPRDITESLTRHFDPQLEPGHFLRAWDDFHRVWRRYTLGVFPAYHTRNEVGDFWNAVVLGGMDVRRAGDALRILTDKTGAQGFGKYSGEQIRTLISQLGVADGGLMGELDNVLTTIHALPKNAWERFWKFADDNRFVQIADKVGRGRENFGRVAMFLDRLAKGYDPQSAALEVKKYLFDFSDLTNYEKRVLRRLAPFYSWTRKNVPLQFVNLIQNPGAAAGVQHLRDEMAGDQEIGLANADLPRFLRQGLPIRWPGGNDEGMPQFLRLEGQLPLADLSAATPAGGFTRAMGLLSPLIQAGVEIPTGVDLYRSDFPGGRVEMLEDVPPLFEGGIVPQMETENFLGVPVPRRLAPVTRLARAAGELDRLNPGGIFGSQDEGPAWNRDLTRRYPDPEAGLRAMSLLWGRPYAIDEAAAVEKTEDSLEQRVQNLERLRARYENAGDLYNARIMEEMIRRLEEQ